MAGSRASTVLSGVGGGRSGTERGRSGGHGPVRCVVLLWAMCYAIATQCPVLTWVLCFAFPVRTMSGTSNMCKQRVCCAMPGTDIGYVLRRLYALPGTDIGYAAARRLWSKPKPLSSGSYAVCGAHVGCHAIRCSVLRPSRTCISMSGTCYPQAYDAV
eukprot:1197138-Rhodomonas_salina.5